MVKLIGLLLIVSGLISLIAGDFINSEYGSKSQISGNAISNILEQPNVELGFFDYAGGAVISYSIISSIMGTIFLFRM